MNCIKKIRGLFRRGSSVPAIPTGNVNKNSKKILGRTSSLQSLSSKEKSQIKTGMTIMNPEIIDSDDENKINTRQKSTNPSQINSNSYYTEEYLINTRQNIEKTKTLSEYESSESSSLQVKEIFDHKNEQNKMNFITSKNTKEILEDEIKGSSNNLLKTYVTKNVELNDINNSKGKIINNDSFDINNISEKESFNSEIMNETKTQKPTTNTINIDYKNENNSNLQHEIHIKNKFELSEEWKQIDHENINNKYIDENVNKTQVKVLKEEMYALRELVRRLNSELCHYQLEDTSMKKYDENDMSSIPKEGPIPLWIVNTKFLSPLISAYDDKLKDSGNLIKFLKKKIDELTGKINILVIENLDLQKKIEKIPHLVLEQYSIEEIKLNEWEQIKRHSQLVLEENIILNEQIELLKQKIMEYQTSFNQEKARLSKKLIELESVNVDLSNKIDTLQSRCSEFQKKYNESIVDNENKIGIKEHLHEMEKNIKKIENDHIKEIEENNLIVKNLNNEKSQLQIELRNKNLINNQLIAEIEVLDRALKEGVGRKTQRKIFSLQKQLELSKIKEKTTYSCLMKLKNEIENKTYETESLKTIAKLHEFEYLKTEKKTSEEILKITKLEQKIHDLKNKASLKLAKNIERLQKKDEDFNLFKLNNDKKISDILEVLQKKQNQIDEFINQKKFLATELNEFIT